MRKSIFIYSLFAVGTLVFSTFPFTEASAQTIRIVSGDGQAVARDEEFTVKVTISGVTTPVFLLLLPDGVGVRFDEGEDYEEGFPNKRVTTNGDVTIQALSGKTRVKDFWTITCYLTPTQDFFEHLKNDDYHGTVEFAGKITGILWFLEGDSTTRYVHPGAPAGTNIGDPVSARHVDNLNHKHKLTYSLSGTDASLFDIDGKTGQLSAKETMGPDGTTYNVTVKVEERRTPNSEVRSSDTIKVTISASETDAGPAQSLTVHCVDARTVTLNWDIPPGLNAQSITGYEYSTDGGETWNTGSTDTSITITGDGYCDLPRAQFKIRARNRNADGSLSFAIISRRPQRRIIQECPVGWVRSDGFAGRTRRVLLYEVKLEMDIHNPISVYKPDWVAIYVHPDEGLENLDGWKLQVAIPYNHYREYLLTAENSVIVDAGFVEGGFAFIENPKENPFPMVGMGFTGSPVPGFDYRLYDETGKRADFGIACYKRFDVFQVLKEMEDPRVLRKVLLESFDWDSHYLRSEWTVPMPAPAAPSLVKKSVVGTWGDLKKQ